MFIRTLTAFLIGQTHDNRTHVCTNYISMGDVSWLPIKSLQQIFALVSHKKWCVIMQNNIPYKITFGRFVTFWIIIFSFYKMVRVALRTFEDIHYTNHSLHLAFKQTHRQLFLFSPRIQKTSVALQSIKRNQLPFSLISLTFVTFRAIYWYRCKSVYSSMCSMHYWQFHFHLSVPYGFKENLFKTYKNTNRK